VGLYDKFIQSISDVSRLRFQRESLVFLAWIGLGAVLAVASLSGLLVDLVVEHRWVMYSLFLGMTLGGVPELLAQARPMRTSVIAATLGGFAAMAAFAYFLTGTQLPASPPVLLLVGALAASSMILPGISGSYLLLIFGLYETVIGSLRPEAIREDWAAAAWILVPVGIGAVLGIALLSNVLRWFLERKPQVAHGMLLGLLVGSILGLWPFQNPVHGELARKDVRKATVEWLEGQSHEQIRAQYGEDFTELRLEELGERYKGKSPGDLKRMGQELERFSPASSQILKAIGLFLLGVCLTRLVGRKGH
jgi:putative membrane protein